jgi:hypothetical protein
MDINSQLQNLVEQQEIQNCIIDYCYYFDTNQPTKLVELFTIDATVDYGPEVKTSKGHTEILDSISRGLTNTFAATSHHVSNFRVSLIDDTRATLICYLYAWHQYKNTDVIGYLWAQYHLELKKIDGQWKIDTLILKGTATQDFHRTNMHPIGRLP